MGTTHSSPTNSYSYSSPLDNTIDKDEPLNYKLDNTNFKYNDVSKEIVKDIPHAFKLRQVLTPEECRDMIHTVFPDKKNFTANHKAIPVLSRAWDPDPEASYRILGSRIFTHSTEVADALFQRTVALLPQTFITYTPTEKRQQVWKIKGLHPRIRFVCYKKGQSFPPHRDDPWIQSPTVRSHFTFCIYLSNGSSKGKSHNFAGGEFAFLDEKNKKPNGNPQEIHIFQPEHGLVIIFPHNTLHESKELTRGYKFMIRSDIMYDLVEEETHKTTETE